MTQNTVETTESSVAQTKVANLGKNSLTNSRGYFQTSMNRFFRRKLNIISLAVFLLIMLICFTAPLYTLALFGTTPDYFRASYSPSFTAPGSTETLRNGTTVVHWLGTDDLGRDMLVRLLHSGGASLSIALLVTFIILAIGVPVGLVSGFFGGWIDDFFNGVIQIINNIPGLYLFIVLGGIFRPDIFFLSLIFGILSWTGTARQVRGLTLSLRQRDFIMASIASGSTYPRVMLKHLLPNIGSILVVLIGADIALAMLTESALSFLGFGIRDPDVSWGKLLTNSSRYLTYSGNHNPILIIGPGLMIFLTLLSVYLIADGLRDAFDPALKN